MATWKDVLAEMTRERSIERARSMIGQGTVYKLGRGGFKPEASLWSEGKTSDCSGFSAWALGIPRELPPGSGHWLQTTTYWKGGEFDGPPPFQQMPFAQAIAGDLLVYPDAGGKQGHIGIVTQTNEQGPVQVVHCSSGNFKKTGDAIRETEPTVFAANAATRLMRVEFDILRAIAGIELPSDDELPQPIAALRSLTLAHDASLKLVASGLLQLERTDEAVGGVAAMQSALRLPVTGIFDAATAEALAAFQRRVSLEPTGTLDAATLLRLDTALVGGLESLSAFDVASEAGLLADEPLGALPVVIRNDDGKFFARVGDSPEFLVGRRVKFLGQFGLMNTSSPGTAKYAAADHVASFGHWANLLEPTAMCEGEGAFDRLNTYDRARFTFGFLQYAAHEPDSDFVQLLRRLLTLPLAASYFPDLTLLDGRVARSVDGETTLLETSSSTAALMDYLNPDSLAVQDEEVINCAKFVHWCAQDPGHRAAQVDVGVAQIRAAMKLNHKRYGLDGRTDVTCLLIFDIHHQGRASVKTVRAALQNATTEEGAWEELLAIGLPDFAERLATLRKHVVLMLSAGVLGQRRYVAAENEFA